MFGTFRTFNEKARQTAADQIRAIATQYATAAGATATVTISMGYPTTANDPRWFGRSTGVLRTTLGDLAVLESAPSMPAEDFSLFLERAPGLFFFLGVTPKGKDPLSMPANHSPMYDVDEASFPTGVKALSALALDALLRGVPPLGPVK
jgi:metal-dependent amidase/aminoacylase/carboxypeptidase family protein